MTVARRALEFVRRVHAVVGSPGLMIAVFSVLSFAFGLYLMVGQYDRPRETGERAIGRIIAHWVRRPDYLGLTLVDYVARWRESPPEERPGRLETMRLALAQLGSDLDRQAENFPVVHIIGMTVKSGSEPALARWNSTARVAAAGPAVEERLALASASGTLPAVELGLRYRVVPALDQGLDEMEASYHRLVLGLLGLSGFSLLCLVYMILNARSLAERVAREAAQEATLDLADRTCHELGNGVFVLMNERRNLAGHLDLVERFIDESPAARAAAAERAGLDPASLRRWDAALRREYAARGIDPEIELRGSAALARHVCHQIDVCSDYISSTVHELDGFLKREQLAVTLARVAVSDCFDEVVSLLEPRLLASEAEVVRSVEPPDLAVSADRRLLIHALVNLVKNAVEAIDPGTGTTRIRLDAGAHGRLARISVTDHGPGMDPALAARVFEPGTTTKGAGRGRGLAIVKESVLLQNGEISVERVEPSGSRFVIELRIVS